MPKTISTINCDLTEGIVSVSAQIDSRWPGLALAITPNRRESNSDTGRELGVKPSTVFAHKYAIIHVASGLIATTVRTKLTGWATIAELALLGDWTRNKETLLDGDNDLWWRARQLCRAANR